MGSHWQQGMNWGLEVLVYSRVGFALLGSLHDVRRNHVYVRMSNMHKKRTVLSRSPPDYPHCHSPSRHPRHQ